MLMTKEQIRDYLVSQGWPRQKLLTEEGLFWGIVMFQEMTTWYKNKVDGIWGPKTQEAAWWVGALGGKVSQHFTAEEFKCRCWERGYRSAAFCGGAPFAKRQLVVAMDHYRNFVGGPVNIINGFRCEAYNRQVGGATRSQHKEGRACDIPAARSTASVKRLGVFTGIGFQGRTNLVRHVDVRTGVSASSPTTWDY